MDDLTFSARRASAAAPARTAEPTDLETRFRTLVQSPLRAGLLRYLSARPDESFDVESLMQTFGRLRLDVENCVRELEPAERLHEDRKSTRLNSSHLVISYAVFCLKKKKTLYGSTTGNAVTVAIKRRGLSS